MVILLVYALVAIIAVGVLYGIALLFLGQEHISPAAADRAPWAISDEQLGPQDIVEVRLPVALRGYRFAETDLLLDRLTEELRLRDEEISQLRAGTSPGPTGPLDPIGPSGPSGPTGASGRPVDPDSAIAPSAAGTEPTSPVGQPAGPDGSSNRGW